MKLYKSKKKWQNRKAMEKDKARTWKNLRNRDKKKKKKITVG